MDHTTRKTFSEKRNGIEQNGILRQITELLEGIHSRGQVHGKHPSSHDEIQILIDSGGKLDISKESLNEWRPAEEADSKPTKEGDVFSLGCYFYYVVTGGEHPFGRSGQRALFISNNLYHLAGCRDKHLRKLIARMINYDCTKRPKSTELLHNPYLWDSKKTEEYLMNVAENTDEYCDQYKKWKGTVLLSEKSINGVQKKTSKITNVAAILKQIKENKENTADLFKMFPNLLSSVYTSESTGSEIEEEIDESRPETLNDLLIANGCFGEVKSISKIKRRHGRLLFQHVHVIQFEKSCPEMTTKTERLRYLNHPNCLQCFYLVENSSEIFMAFEGFHESLEIWLQNKKKKQLECEIINDILRQITKGLVHYHSNQLTHGNLSLSQIVIFEKATSPIVAKVASFSLSHENSAASAEKDIRELGQVFSYLLSECQQEVSQSHVHLIRAMKELALPSAAAVLKHPLLWSPEMTTSFLLAADDYYEQHPEFDKLSKLDFVTSAPLNSNQQYLRTNREALKAFSSEIGPLATVKHASFVTKWTKKFPKLILQTWLRLQEFKGDDYLDISSFYHPNYNFPEYDELLCDEKNITTIDDDTPPPQMSTTSSQSEIEFSIEQFSNPPDRKLNKWIPDNISSGADNKIERYLSNYVQKWEVANIDNPGKIKKHPTIDPFERTAMHLACHSDDFYDLAVKLFEFGSNPDAKDINGYAPLHVAAENEKAIKITQLLIDKKATIDICANNSITPLFFAVISNSPRTTKLLIKSHADVTKLDSFGRSPLHFAVATNSKENVGLLLLKLNHKNVREIIDAVDRDGMSPLHIAVANNSIDMVEYLLKKYKANPNVGKLDPTKSNIQQIEKKIIPVLHLAVERQLVSVIDLLLKAGADPDITNLHGQTSLHIAAALSPPSTDCLKIVNKLIENRADVNAVDNKGITVLHVAIFNEANEIVQRLLECKPHIEVDKKEKERAMTPLHLAAWKNFEKITEMLIKQGSANVDAKDKNGDTPLEYAASSDAIIVAKKLLDAGAFPKKKRWNGRSPLHVAAAHDARQVGELLISKDADVNARDDLELTPLHYAHFRGHDKFVELLTRSKDNQSSIANPPVSKQLTPTELKTIHQLTNSFKLNIPSQLKIELPPIVAQFNEFKLQITQGLIIDGFQSN